MLSGCNYINAIDGDSNTIVDTDAGSGTVALPITGATLSQNIPEVTMQSSMTVTPTAAAIGDTIQITIKDFYDVTWTAGGSGVGAPRITLGGVLVTTPATNPNANGEATFNITIPNGVPSGTQQLKIFGKSTYAVNDASKDLTISGATLKIGRAHV